MGEITVKTSGKSHWFGNSMSMKRAKWESGSYAAFKQAWEPYQVCPAALNH